jgi:hypothetical protein
MSDDIRCRLRNPWPDYISMEARRETDLMAADVIDQQEKEIAELRAALRELVACKEPTNNDGKRFCLAWAAARRLAGEAPDPAKCFAYGKVVNTPAVAPAAPEEK